MSAGAVPTVGVEEEFFLADIDMLRPVAVGPGVVAHARAAGIDAVSELTEVQVEANSPPLQCLRELRENVISTRATLSAVALAQGAHLLAAGVSPVAPADRGRLPISDGSRYRRLAETYGALAESVATCGGHIHVEVPDKETAIGVCNVVRPWLPTLLALTCNSAIHDGVDTRHSSWRSTVWGRWPTAGPPPHLSSTAEYDDLVGSMIETGMILDEASLYWDVRPSSHQPTVEVRVGDVPAVAEEVVLSAALVRGLVVTALRSIDRGEPALVVAGNHLAAAYHRARMDGLTGVGVDPSTGRPVSASSLLRSLVRYVEPALTSTGDLRCVQTSLERLTHLGNGAQRQRRIFSRNADAAAVAAHAARFTTAEWNSPVAQDAG